MEIDQITGEIINASIKIHKKLGPGLFESIYEEVLNYELINRGFFVERQVGLPVIYGDIKMDIGYRADLIVDREVIVEIKSVETVLPVHKKQLLTYLRLNQMSAGLLINFNEPLLKNGIYRIVNNFTG